MQHWLPRPRMVTILGYGKAVNISKVAVLGELRGASGMKSPVVTS